MSSRLANPRLRAKRPAASVAAIVLFVPLAFGTLGCSDGKSSVEKPAGNPLAVGPTKSSDPQPVVASPADPACAIQLHEVTAQSGITFQHRDGSSGRRYVVEAMSTGIATFDYDNDGLIDIYFPNGAPLPGCQIDPPPRHALYRNLGGWRFEDVSERAGVACSSYGMGVTIGDYDSDGDPDIYLSNFGPNVLYRNNGDGTFTDVTAHAGVARGDLVGAGACFLDGDRNGTLDLYVGNYIQLDCAQHVPHTERGHPAYPSPREYSPVMDTYFRNQGDGTFVDASQESGIAAHAGRSMGMVCSDYDNDGDTDVFVCNDVQANFLFRNDGGGRFEEVAALAGVAMSRQGEMLANMGVDCADFDQDGMLDFFTTNYQGQLPMLFRNFGDSIFEDVAVATKASEGSYPYVNWGCGFVDFDNDGHRDLYIANGHTEDNIEQRDLSTAYRCPNLLLRNTGTGRFVNVSAEAGDGLLPVEASRGTAFDDLDNDGDVDAVVLNSRTRPTILRNMLQESHCSHHWIQVRLVGTRTNRGGVGAHVAVMAGGAQYLDEVHSGRGYQSHWGSRLHFGLGVCDRVERVEVRWIGGAVQVIEQVPVDRVLTIVER